MTPMSIKLGEKVFVTMRNQIKPKTGLVHVVPAREVESRVTKVYSDGRVMVTSGDVWTVRRTGRGLITLW